MAQFTYASPAGRINKLKGEILGHAVGVEVLGITGMQREIPKNNGKTVVYRRYLPFGATDTNANTQNRPVVDAAAHVLTEGVTPTADTLVPKDITVTLSEFGCLYQLTNIVADTYEDDIPTEMKQQCGERVGMIREMVRYGAIKAGTNVYYSGGTSRATVSKAVSLNDLRKVSRNLQSNHAKRVTSVLAPTPNISSRYVESGYLVFCSSDVESDIRAILGPDGKSAFTPVAAYGQRKPVCDTEIGSIENFRFIISPELTAYRDSGADIGTTGLYSTTGAKVDVYPVIVVGENAWGQVALRGENSLDPTYIPPNTKDKSDPLGQRGYIGARFLFNAAVLNDGWMAIIESGVSAL